MSTPATLHHLADALTALRAARGATACGDTADDTQTHTTMLDAICERQAERYSDPAL